MIRAPLEVNPKSDKYYEEPVPTTHMIVEPTYFALEKTSRRLQVCGSKKR